jgi:hypothetical protein
VALGAATALGCSDSSAVTNVRTIDRDARVADGSDGAEREASSGETSGDARVDGGAAADADVEASAAADAESGAARGDDGPGVLVGYDIRGADRRLFVLDPETGRPLSSETLGVVHAVVNDGAPFPNDRWYVFEQVGAVDDGLTVHVRSLDATTRAFQELGAVENAPNVFGNPVTFGPGAKRLVAYLSDVSSGASKAELSLVVIDATDPVHAALATISGSLPPGPKLGLLGDRGSLDVVTAESAPCPNGSSGSEECAVSAVQAAAIGSGVTLGTPNALGSIGPAGNVGVAIDPLRHEAVLGFAPLSPPATPTCGSASRTTAEVRRFPSGATVQSASVSVPSEAARFTGAAFDACDDVAFFTSDSGDVAIWAVPFASTGIPTKVCASAPGGPLVFEPSSRTLFRAVASGGIEAYRVDASASKPKLTQRSLTELPVGAAFGVLAVVSPTSPSCL